MLEICQKVNQLYFHTSLSISPLSTCHGQQLARQQFAGHPAMEKKDYDDMYCNSYNFELVRQYDKCVCICVFLNEILMYLLVLYSRQDYICMYVCIRTYMKSWYCICCWSVLQHLCVLSSLISLDNNIRIITCCWYVLPKLGLVFFNCFNCRKKISTHPTYLTNQFIEPIFFWVVM